MTKGALEKTQLRERLAKVQGINYIAINKSLFVEQNLLSTNPCTKNCEGEMHAHKSSCPGWDTDTLTLGTNKNFSKEEISKN